MLPNTDEAVVSLLDTVLEYENQPMGGGSMTCAIYDTAWVSMIRRQTSAGSFWLFPESFILVCHRQEVDGGWNKYGQQADRIIDSAAALLAICKYLEDEQSESLGGVNVLHDDLSRKAENASRFLKSALDQWEIASCDHVGFEIIVPSLLDRLQAFGHDFDFPDRGDLIKLRQKKLERFDVDMLESPSCPQLSILYSLEALTDKVDFDKINHLKRFGSFLASPSATAASLIHGKKWDTDSEEYLRHALLDGEGHGSGGVPSAFPSQWFELSWAVTTLIECGYDIRSLTPVVAHRITESLQNALIEGSGLVGWAPQLLPDADDTAKMILAVRSLGGQASTQALISNFEDEHHFKTYSSERTVSVSTNCHVLLALLSRDDEFETVRPAVEKVVQFLCRRWFRGASGFGDKWNSSIYYPKMLMACALTRLLDLNTQQSSRASINEACIDRVNLVVHDILVSTLSEQSPNGSWEESVEPTCYAVIAIGKIYRLSLAMDLVPQMKLALAAAEAYLETGSKAHLPDRIWVVKVTYGSLVLSEAYQLGARKIMTDILASDGDGQSPIEDGPDACAR